MVIINNSNLDLGTVKNQDKIPFEFQGSNGFKVPVIIVTSGSCGCTTSISNFSVQPNDSFKITGTLNRRKTAGTYKKKITVKVMQDAKKVIQNIDLFFTVNLTR